MLAIRIVRRNAKESGPVPRPTDPGRPCSFPSIRGRRHHVIVGANNQVLLASIEQQMAVDSDVDGLKRWTQQEATMCYGCALPAPTNLSRHRKLTAALGAARARARAVV